MIEIVTVTEDELPEIVRKRLRAGGRIIAPPQGTTTPPKKAPARPWITVAEFIELTGISRGCAYRAIKAGQIPSKRFGRIIRVQRP